MSVRVSMFWQVYHPPAPDASYHDVGRYIEQLPVHDNPDLFGMDLNAEKAYLELQAETLVGTILSVQPRVTSGLVGYVRHQLRAPSPTAKHPYSIPCLVPSMIFSH